MLEDKLDMHAGLLNEILCGLHINGTTQVSKFNFPPDYFPVKIPEEMDSLATLLGTDPGAYDTIVEMLRQCGGGTVDDAVKLMMRKLMTDEMLAGHCYKGQSTKKSFSNYVTIVNAMLESLLRNPRVKSLATKENLDRAIPKQLKQAVDRLTQRKRNAATVTSNDDGRI